MRFCQEKPAKHTFSYPRSGYCLHTRRLRIVVFPQPPIQFERTPNVHLLGNPKIHRKNDSTSTTPLEHPKTTKSHLLPLRSHILRVGRNGLNFKRPPLPRKTRSKGLPRFGG